MDSYADKDQDDTSEDDWHKPSEAVGGGGVGCFPQQGHLLSVLINVTHSCMLMVAQMCTVISLIGWIQALREGAYVTDTVTLHSLTM